ncbi:hypothetical protein lerEdw1_005740 [Lerista edwardsae]|nr:hypothetical protein lerEdw1_005740 [Lerista edwardsae]
MFCCRVFQIRMHNLVKEEARPGRNGVGQNASLDQTQEQLPMKLCSGSSHAEQILQTLDSYRRDSLFTDVVLVMEGQEFPCHRATLSANSAYFRARFAGGLQEDGQETISLPETSASAMSLLLDYMYGGRIVIQEENVEGILKLSSLLQIPRLKDACVAFLEDQLRPCNCVGTLRLARSFGIAPLAERSKRCVLEGFAEVSHCQEFLQLDLEELTECLSSDQLAVPREEAVLEAGMRWVRHDAAARKGALKGLLQCVRLPLLDPVYFLEKVAMDTLLRGSKECLPLLQEAHKHHILGTGVSSQWSRPRRFMESAETILVIGGCAKRGRGKLPFVDRLHPDRGAWKLFCSVPGYTKSEFAACALKNDVYISGGHVDSRDVWMLSSQLKVWVKVASLRKGRWRHRMVTLLGKVFFLSTWLDSVDHSLLDIGIATFKKGGTRCSCVSVHMNSSHQCSCVKYRHLQYVEIRHGIYAVGGYDGFDRLSSVECYDAFSNSWMAVAPLPEAVSSAAAAPCLNKLYVIGGAVDDNTSTDQVQCYDPEGNMWSLQAPAPLSQWCINAVTLDDRIYVAGGLLSTIFSFDPQKDSWSELASLPGPLERCGVTACDGKIYILGGRDENGEGTDKAFAVDPETGLVEPQPPLQRCTSDHGCVTILQRVGR